MAIGASAQWRIVPAGTYTNASNNNAGGFDSGISGAGTDYTLEANTPSTLGGPIISFAAGTSGGSINTSVFQDTTNSPFTSAMVGNCLRITAGTNFTAGFYFITAFNSASSVTLDRNYIGGTAGTGASYNVGGCWADCAAITSSNAIGGNTVNIRGGGTDNPSSPDYTQNARLTSGGGSSSTGFVKWLGYNGRPRIQRDVSESLLFVSTNSYIWFENLYFACSATSGNSMMFQVSGIAKNVIFDQNGKDCSIGSVGIYIDCEFFSSSAVGAAANGPVVGAIRDTIFLNCNFHDLSGGAEVISLNNTTSIKLIGCVFANNKGNYVHLGNSDAGTTSIVILNNTFDGGQGHGLLIDSATILIASPLIMNNIFSNFTTAAKYAINMNFGSSAANVLLAAIINYNDFFNNTANFNNFSSQTDRKTGSTGDLTLDPQYAAQATQGFNIGTNLKAKAFPPQVFMQHKASQTATQTYLDMGAVQRQEPAGGGTTIVVNTIRNITKIGA